ncbi:MAG TPA: tetratricopeptide repeat protein [Planctomycetaceae bacterium]|nr:tetratricopeptide repeat protein [Planctomycetaceae bacterium]
MIQELESLIADFPDVPQFRFELADALCFVRPREREPERSRGEAGESFNPDDRAERAWSERARIERAAALAAELTRAWPQVPQYQALTASAARRLAAIHRREGALDEADRLCSDAAETYRQLAGRFPSLTLYSIAWAQTLSERADILLQAGDREGAQRESAAAVDVAEACLDSRGSDPVFRRFLDRLVRQRDQIGGGIRRDHP